MTKYEGDRYFKCDFHMHLLIDTFYARRYIRRDAVSDDPPGKANKKWN